MGGLGERRRLGGLIVGEAADGAKAGGRRLRGRRGTDLRKAAKRTAGGHLPQRKRASLAAQKGTSCSAIGGLSQRAGCQAVATEKPDGKLFSHGKSHDFRKIYIYL